jgi:hypothetical protein
MGIHAENHLQPAGFARTAESYLEFLSAIEDPRAGRNKLDKLSQPVEQEGRRYSGFNLFDPDDENLLCSIVRGEFNISGLQNKTLRHHLPELNSSQVSAAPCQSHVPQVLPRNPFRKKCRSGSVDWS